MSDQPPQPPQQPYPPYYPPPAQQPQRASYNPFDAAFWRNMSTAKLSIVTVVCVLLALLVCVAPFMVAKNITADSVRTSIAMQPTATALPTLPPQPTDTPKPTGPQPLSGATLGGTQDGFTAKLGDPTDQSGVPWYSIKLSNGTTANLCYCTEHTGSDGNPHLASFHIDAPSGTIWSDQQGASVARPFFPPDATHVREFTDPQIGLIHVYASADLAATFPVREFTDSGNGQQLPAGTFAVACGQPGPSQCSIVTGD